MLFKKKIDRRKILIDVAPDCFSGNILKQLRAKRRYSASGLVHSKGNTASKRQVANKLGCHPQQLMRWERYPYGKDCNAAPNLKFFKKMCLYFQVDPCVLLGLRWLGKELAADHTYMVDDEYCMMCGSYKGVVDDVPEKWVVKGEDKVSKK